MMGVHMEDNMWEELKGEVLKTGCAGGKMIRVTLLDGESAGIARE